MKKICEYCGSEIDTEKDARCPVCMAFVPGSTAQAEQPTEQSTEQPAEPIDGEPAGEDSEPEYLSEQTPAETDIEDENDEPLENIYYKCPTCDSPLRFDPKLQMAKCYHCGNEYDIKTLKRYAVEDETEFCWGDYREKFDSEAEMLTGTHVYQCKYCGADIETDATTSATHCPYCDNEVIISDKLSSGIKPNYIIPFEYDKKDIIKLTEDFAKSRPLLPDDFFSKARMEKLRGVYVPFWLFDADVDGDVRLKAFKSSTYSDSDYHYTETSEYLIEADAAMDFRRVPVDGSTKADDDLMDSLEPYDYSKMVPFDTAYMTGYVSDRFDCDPDASLPRADSRIRATAYNRFVSELQSGYSSTSVVGATLNLSNTDVKYALLPVYIINYLYESKYYRIAINGQTGKIVGTLPISKEKKKKSFWKPFGISAGVFIVIMFILRLLRHWLFG